MEVSGQLDVPASLPPGERTYGIRWIIGWVDTRDGLDEVMKRKISLSLPGVEHRSSSP